MTAIRIAYGVALLTAPDAVCRPVARQPLDHTAAAFARVLGARQLVEGLLLANHGERPWPAVGAAVDATHAVTMLALGAFGKGHRRLALINAVVATGFAAEGFREARHATDRP